MYVLGERKPSVPIGLAVVNENTKVLFKPLIRAFGLSVSLGVIGGAYVLFDVKDAAEFFWKMGCEASIAVGDNLAWSTVVWKNMLDVKVGDGGGGGRFMAGDENGSLRAIVVCDGEDAVESIGKWEFNDEVHSDGLKGEGGTISCNEAMRNTRARGVNFGGLAGGATPDEGGDKGFHMGPPVILGNEEAGFEDTGVTCSGGVMV